MTASVLLPEYSGVSYFVPYSDGTRNAQVKWFAPKANMKDSVRHAIAFLNEHEWEDVVGRGKPGPGIMRINGTPVAIGNAAQRRIIKDRPKGAARYNEIYYGAGLGAALAEGLQRSDARVSLWASYAPGDAAYARHLVTAAQRHWTVECQYGTLEFDVTSVNPFDEPLGGLWHYVLNEDGAEKKKNLVKDQTVLIIDVGGYTVDVCAVDPGGEIDVSTLKSTRTGVLKVLTDFETSLRKNNLNMFQNTPDLDPRRVESAIRFGCYKYGNQQIDCHVEAEQALNSLVNDVVQIIQANGTAANYDAILMTGGGTNLIIDCLREAIRTVDFIPVEPNSADLMFANVYGGAKMAALMRREVSR